MANGFLRMWTHTAWLAVAVYGLVCMVGQSIAQPRTPDGRLQSWEEYVRNTTSIDAALAHPIMMVDLGPGLRSVIALTEQPKGQPAHWLVFVPARNDPTHHDRLTLPVSDARHGFVEIKAVFAENIDRDPENELLILCEQMTGIGPTSAQPWHETYVYDWTGKAFVLRETVRKQLVNLSTAAQVRATLRRLR